LLLGAAIFLFYEQTREVANEAPDRIIVSSGQLEQLVANYRRTWMRAPTQDELNALIENYVREEVFYREALALGLDQDDPQVRRRMRMKLEFILEDLSSQDVTDEKLAAFLRKHPDKFRIEARVSFQQVYLNPDNYSDLESAAEKLLVRLNDDAAVEDQAELLGDTTMMPGAFQLASKTEIARFFGKRFAGDVINLVPDGWSGPVYSEYGGHLVKIDERIESRQPALEDVRTQVEREYLAQMRKLQKDQAYEQLRRGYEVSVEGVNTEDLNPEPMKAAQASEIK
jgi:hypothetical protein